MLSTTNSLESSRSLSKMDLFEIINYLNNTAMLMKTQGCSNLEITDRINNEIESVKPFFKLDEPYYDKVSEKNLYYLKSVIYFNNKTITASLADIYMFKNNFTVIVTV